ncbi:MAG: hypothetical protein Q8L66_10435 [Caulobacter sp.]|nr:hypothetical protein [Caulobacter sp.]
MAGYYFSAALDNDTTICLAPLSDRRLELSGEDLTDTSGYFLYTVHHGAQPEAVEILARVQSEDAAWRLKGMFGLS